MKDNQTEVESRRTDERLKVRGNSGKKTKDPNKPKRPPSPFFVFLDDFRKEFNEANPDNRSVSSVGKAAGKKWKLMCLEERAPFVAKANTKKSEHAVIMQQYRMELANGTKAPGDDSDKTNSKVNEANETKTSGADSDKTNSEVNEANGTKTPGADSDKTSSDVNEANETKTPGADSDKTNSEVNEEKLVGGSDEVKDDA